MAQYRRRKDRDTWHFCSNCSNYPKSDYVTSPSKPSGGTTEFCNECKSKREKGDCT